jgi:cytochrome bd ubiquinol oxidase subunit I
MINNMDLSLVDWSRAQFALTAIYHWIFVPLTLGLSLIIAIMESIYVKTGNEEFKRMTKFWMTLFGINFALGVATGIILEFEFGTNWSSYSWFVGDIFGAPLAIEGIFAFFLESTFVAVMFFGWNKVSKKFHLASTWLVSIGANLSALWILVANGWMQNPVGMIFNPDTMRNEMVDFWAVLFNPSAIDKFTHTVFSGFLLGSVFVIGISSWFLLKKREPQLFRHSILISSIVGLVSSFLVAYTGDSSAKTMSKVQPVKFAAMEAHYYGKTNADLTAIGILKKSGSQIEDKEILDFAFRIKIPGFLSILTGGNTSTYVPGLYDLVLGPDSIKGIIPVFEKMNRGKFALNVLTDYKRGVMINDTQQVNLIRKEYFGNRDFMNEAFRYFGYGYLGKPSDAIPNVALSFYSFHVMVIIGGFLIALCILSLFFALRDSIEKHKWFIYISIISIPLTYLSSMAGWVLAEAGRQPWIIQDLMPVSRGVTQINTGSVIATFIIFAVLFTALLIAEISIMLKQIKNGPTPQEDKK